MDNYVPMPQGVPTAFDDLLPVRIDEAEVEGPTLMLKGTGWSLAAMCHWRWAEPGERIITESDPEASDAVWDLVGHQILGVEWIRTAHGIDPTIALDGGVSLEIRSDAAFDTWTIHTPDLVLVGPLPVKRRTPRPRRLGVPEPPRFSAVSGQGSPGICDICGRTLEPNAAFVNIGPTDWTDPSKPKSRRWVPAGTDIHGWTPFVVEHPACFAEVNGQAALDWLQAQPR